MLHLNAKRVIDECLLSVDLSSQQQIRIKNNIYINDNRCENSDTSRGMCDDQSPSEHLCFN